MDEPLDDEGTTGSAALDEALDRLTSRFAPGTARLLPVDALTLVYRAQLGQSPAGDTPTQQDLADALLLVTTARDDLVRRVDLAELTITDALRGHWTWEQIGIHLGRPTETARQNASSRFQRLLPRFPGFRPIHTSK